MAIDPVSEDLLREAVEARKKHISGHEAARSLGLAESTFRHRLKMATRRGLYQPVDVPPGFEIAKLSETQDASGNLRSRSIQMRPEREGGFNLLPGHTIKGLSTLLDGEGRVAQQWIKTKAEVDPLDMVEAIKEAFADFEPLHVAEPAVEREYNDRRVLVVLPDLHFGLMTHKDEVGENFDLKIARRQYGKAIRELIDASPSSEEAIILGLGDQLHTQSGSNVTPASGHHLQVDGRVAKILETTCTFFVDTVDLALKRHKRALVRIIRGNHDVEGAIAIAYFLKAWFRNNPRVTVDVSPSPFWWYRFKNTLLGAAHGHLAKANDMPLIMATRAASDWGQSKYRFIHLGHLHHAVQRVHERGGCIVETYQSPAPQDEYAYGNFTEAGRSLTSIVYCPERGEIGRHRVTVCDS